MATEKILGNRERLSAGEESTYGSKASSQEFTFGRNATFEPNQDDENFIEILSSGTDDIEITKEEGPKSRGGTISFAPQDWRFLKHVFGDGSNDVTTVDQGSYFEHTFSLQPVVSSFTFQRFFEHSSNEYGANYLGSQVESCSISFESGEGEEASLMTVDLEIISQDRSKASNNDGPAPAGTDAFQFRNVNFTFGGSQVIELNGGTIDITNNLNDARYANYDNLDRLKDESNPQIRRISGTFRCYYDDARYFDEQTGDTVSGTNEFEFKRGTNDRLVLPLTNFRVERVVDPTNLEGNNEARVEWSADSFNSPFAEDQISSY
jgi:hypothetical protein